MKFVMVVPIVFAILTGGCDNFVLSEQYGPTEANLGIRPSLAVARPGDTLHFTAAGGVPAYSFTVIEAGGGSIDPETGVYTAPAYETETTITVTDAELSSSEALVYVVAEKSFRVLPSTVTVKTGEQYQFSASGGTPPYSFSLVSDDTIGSIVESTGLFAAAADGIGAGTVRVTDGGGSVVSARVYVRDEVTLMLTPQVYPLQQGQTTILFPTGGTPPYTVTLRDSQYHSFLYSDPATGAGDVLDNTYTAGNSIGEVIVRVRDDANDTYDLAMRVLPATPQNFVIDGFVGGPNEFIQLSWKFLRPGTTMFLIERSEDGGDYVSTGDPILFVEPGDYTFTDKKDREPDTRYCEYRVFAVTIADGAELISPPTASKATLSNLE